MLRPILLTPHFGGETKPRKSLYPNLDTPESDDFFQNIGFDAFSKIQSDSTMHFSPSSLAKTTESASSTKTLEQKAEEYMSITQTNTNALLPLERSSIGTSAADICKNDAKPTAMPVVLSDVIANQAKEAGINLSAADKRKMENLEESARVNLLRTGVYTTATVVLGVAAVHFAALPAAVSACAIGLVTAVTKLVDLTTQLVTNPRVLPAFKGILNSIMGFFGFGGKSNNGVQFAGKDKELQKEKMTIGTYCKTLFNNLTELLSQFEKETTQEKRQLKVMEMQKEIIATSAALINSNGSEEEKGKTAAAQQFLKLYEDYVNTVPLHAKTYAEVPRACQSKLKQMIYVSLTSNVPYLTEWGRIQATQVGMNSEAIERAIQSGNK